MPYPPNYQVTISLGDHDHVGQGVIVKWLEKLEALSNGQMVKIFHGQNGKMVNPFLTVEFDHKTIRQ